MLFKYCQLLLLKHLKSLMGNLTKTQIPGDFSERYFFGSFLCIHFFREQYMAFLLSAFNFSVLRAKLGGLPGTPGTPSPPFNFGCACCPRCAAALLQKRWDLTHRYFRTCQFTWAQTTSVNCILLFQLPPSTAAAKNLDLLFISYGAALKCKGKGAKKNVAGSH